MTGLGRFIEIVHTRMGITFNNMDVDWSVRVNPDGSVKAIIYSGPPTGDRKRSHVSSYLWSTYQVERVGLESNLRGWLMDRTIEELRRHVLAGGQGA